MRARSPCMARRWLGSPEKEASSPSLPASMAAAHGVNSYSAHLGSLSKLAVVPLPLPLLLGFDLTTQLASSLFLLISASTANMGSLAAPVLCLGDLRFLGCPNSSCEVIGDDDATLVSRY